MRFWVIRDKMQYGQLGAGRGKKPKAVTKQSLAGSLPEPQEEQLAKTKEFLKTLLQARGVV